MAESMLLESACVASRFARHLAGRTGPLGEQMPFTRTRRLLPTAALAGLLIMTSAPTAVADTKTRHDPRGDAIASADVTRASISNRRSRVVVTLRVRGLRRHSDVTMKINHRRRGHFVVRTAGARPTRARLTFARGVDEQPRRCARLRAIRKLRRDRIRIRVPQRCFGARAGGARFNITAYQHGGMGSDRLRSVWVSRG